MNKESTKKIGLWNIVGLGVGGAVGSGIFVTLGSAIAKTGRSILPITIICVFYMLLAYWYNLAMSGVFIIEGGDYSMKGTFPYKLFKQLMACASRTQTTQQCNFADALFLADYQGKPCGHIVPEHCNHPSGGCTGAVCGGRFLPCQYREFLQCFL